MSEGHQPTKGKPGTVPEGFKPNPSGSGVPLGLGLQFMERHTAYCVAAIDNGETSVRVQPQLLAILLEDCGKMMGLRGENERLKEGIEDIAGRLDGWTDHDGVGPAEALLALIAQEDGE